MNKCFHCGEEIQGYRSIAFIFVGGERVPIHLAPCLNEHLSKQEHQCNDIYAVPVLKPCPSNH